MTTQAGVAFSKVHILAELEHARLRLTTAITALDYGAALAASESADEWLDHANAQKGL